jgi:acyl-CoA synthetase (AMP-forming)/AMP-acid ligase II
MEIRIVAEGRDVAQGEIGEIWVRGPSLMDGYFGDPQATESVMRPGGWLATGDLGRRDAAGHLEIAGRIKELIIHSGFNVYPAEVEAVLNAHPAVQQAAVVGRRTADGNEEVIAFVQPRSEARVSPEEIRSFAAQRLAPYKKPAAVIMLAQLPVGPTGKVLKRDLQRLAEAH